MAEEFIKRLSHLGGIGSDDAAALRSAFQRVRSYHKSDDLFEEGDVQDHLYIVRSGWYYSFTMLTDGSRQIHEIFMAGDVIGMENLSWVNATSSVACAVSGEVLPAPISKIRDMLLERPKLDCLFRTVYTTNNVLLIDRLTAVARLDAYNRVAFFLSDALARQNLYSETPEDILHMPFSQNFIADCLGLSSVHVSRQFGKLISNGLIEKIGRKNIRVLNRPKLQIEGDYKNRFGRLTLQSLP